jgi:hypothetical protein
MMLKPLIVEVEMGFLNPVTLNATSIPPVTLAYRAPVTISTELEKEHCIELDSTATVEHETTL